MRSVTPTAAAYCVACRQHGTQAVLEVWDTGIGIAPEHQQEVFREFHQLGNPERDHRKGLGLGLAIAEGLARTLGHGLSLVFHPQSRQRVPAYFAHRQQHTRVTRKYAMTQSKTRLLNARVLVIDDDEIVREGMLHLLRDWGCECDAAESIEEALALARLRPARCGHQRLPSARATHRRRGHRGTARFIGRRRYLPC